MIRIKHKQTKQVKTIPVYEWDQGQYNHETWTVVSENNLVQLFAWHPNQNIWLKRHRMEKKDAIKLVTENPNTHRFEDLQASGSIKDRVIARNEYQSLLELRKDELSLTQPIIRPDKKAIKQHTNETRTGTSSFKKWLSQISIKYIIETIIATLIAIAIAYYLHLNAVRK